jgi:hypothetical protein
MQIWTQFHQWTTMTSLELEMAQVDKEVDQK